MPIFNFSGSRPNSIGLKNGQLTKCPEGSLNCVQSGADGLLPWPAEKGEKEAIQKLLRILQMHPEFTVVTALEHYLHVEFTSWFFGFVDDLEFHASGGLLHYRSASRVGRSDLGANRQRLEKIHRLFIS